MKKIAISIGDLNGIGIEVALKAHNSIKSICKPLYMIDKKMFNQSCSILKIDPPSDFTTFEIGKSFKITPSLITKESGEYSYKSFLKAIFLAKDKKVDAIVTLPINKKAWHKAGIKYKGHTDLLHDIFNKNAIMMIGCEKLYCAFFTHHVALSKVSSLIKKEPLRDFLVDFYNCIKENNIAVLAFNPHAGDGGILGDEESIIQEAIKEANKRLNKEIFKGPLVPDTAFTKTNREKFKYFVAMYHDQGLIAVKSLYFEESINVSLNLPIIRTSVDHGSAFDIAYKDKNPSTKSYINAIKKALQLSSQPLPIC